MSFKEEYLKKDYCPHAYFEASEPGWISDIIEQKEEDVHYLELGRCDVFCDLRDSQDNEKQICYYQQWSPARLCSNHASHCEFNEENLPPKR